MTKTLIEYHKYTSEKVDNLTLSDSLSIDDTVKISFVKHEQTILILYFKMKFFLSTEKSAMEEFAYYNISKLNSLPEEYDSILDVSRQCFSHISTLIEDNEFSVSNFELLLN